MKSLEKEHMLMYRRRAARLNDGSHRSGAEDTYATNEDTTDNESELLAPDTLLCAVEEGYGDSYDGGGSGDDNTASHCEVHYL